MAKQKKLPPELQAWGDARNPHSFAKLHPIHGLGGDFGPDPEGATFNQYVARTDKSRKPRSLHLTGVSRASVFAKTDASGVILET
jgi:hypothetical protein